MRYLTICFLFFPKVFSSLWFCKRHGVIFFVQLLQRVLSCLWNGFLHKHTSLRSMVKHMWVSLQVLGNAKGAVAVVVSILIFRNPVSVTGMMGYSLTVIGVILYSEAKKRSKWYKHPGKSSNWISQYVLIFLVCKKKAAADLGGKVYSTCLSVSDGPSFFLFLNPSTFFFFPPLPGYTHWKVFPFLSATTQEIGR